MLIKILYFLEEEKNVKMSLSRELITDKNLVYIMCISFHTIKDVKNILGKYYINLIDQIKNNPENDLDNFHKVYVDISEEDIFYSALKYPESYENMKKGKCFED